MLPGAESMPPTSRKTFFFLLVDNEGRRKHQHWVTPVAQRHVSAPSLKVPMAMDRALGSLSWSEHPAHSREGGGWNYMTFKVPLDLSLSTPRIFQHIHDGPRISHLI